MNMMPHLDYCIIYTAMATTTDSKRTKWSLHINIPDAQKSTIIVDASSLRHCQPRQTKNLANIAMGSVRNGHAGTSSTWGAHVHPPPQRCPSNATRRKPIRNPPIDRELQQVLGQVKNAQKDELEFQAWKRSIESHYQHPTSPEIFL
jgi:hypothetical protein